MKFFLLLFSLAFLSGNASADNEVPVAVKAAFAFLFPDVHEQDIHWDTMSEGLVATFNDDDKLKKALFTENGEWLETRIRIYPTQLPRRLSEHYEANYRDVDVTFLAKVLLPEGSCYRIESETYEEVVIEVFDKEGRLMESRSVPFTEGLELY